MSWFFLNWKEPQVVTLKKSAQNKEKKKKNVVRNDSILSANCGIAVFYPGGQIFERKS